MSDHLAVKYDVALKFSKSSTPTRKIYDHRKQSWHHQDGQRYGNVHIQIRTRLEKILAARKLESFPLSSKLHHATKNSTKQASPAVDQRICQEVNGSSRPPFQEGKTKQISLSVSSLLVSAQCYNFRDQACPQQMRAEHHGWPRPWRPQLTGRRRQTFLGLCQIDPKRQCWRPNAQHSWRPSIDWPRQSRDPRWPL